MCQVTLQRARSSAIRTAVVQRDAGEFFDRFGALSRCLRATAAQSYALIDVGSTQAKFLRHIGRHSRISQADLSRATGTDPALTGRALETLVERGWVRRKRSEEDRRQYILELSAAGQRARERVEKAREVIALRVLSVLEEADVAAFERIVDKVLSAFDAPTEVERDVQSAFGSSKANP